MLPATIRAARNHCVEPSASGDCINASFKKEYAAGKMCKNSRESTKEELIPLYDFMYPSYVGNDSPSRIRTYWACRYCARERTGAFCSFHCLWEAIKDYWCCCCCF